MNKTELVNRVAKEADISKPTANKALNAVIDGITESLKKAIKLHWLVLAHSSHQKEKQELVEILGQKLPSIFPRRK